MKSRPYLKKQITQYMQLLGEGYEVSHPTLGAEILFRVGGNHDKTGQPSTKLTR
jgi:hypothetical protein